MRRPSAARLPGFSLVELVVVVLIIAMLAGLAIPRMSRGSTGAAEASLVGDLSVIRKAILLYAIEHNSAFPGADAATVVAQLTTYSNAAGSTSATRTAVCPYGPYLARIPPCPVGPKAGSNEICIDSVNSPPAYRAASTAGWVYNPNTGEFCPNVPAEQLTEIITGFMDVGGPGMLPAGS
jgi:prepilin-type N-terminal cleavage/methylation domain-containing protein